jgi:hypothetical protein
VSVHGQVDRSRVDLCGAGVAMTWRRCWGNGDAGGCGGSAIDGGVAPVVLEVQKEADGLRRSSGRV